MSIQPEAGSGIAHTCHWPGCGKPVPPAMWGCKIHWFRLPKPLRDRIWATYRPGQEITKTPSPAYLDAARTVREWIAENDHPHTYRDVSPPARNGDGDHLQRCVSCPKTRWVEIL